MTRAFVVLSILVASLAACSAPAPLRRDVVVGLVGEPSSVFADEPGARFLASAVTEPLVAVDTRGDFVPRLATAVPTLANGALRVVMDDPAAPNGRLVATFRLRDATWQDGEPVTAQDVRYAHDVDALAPLGTEARWLADRIESVDVVDDHYVRVVYRANERWEDYPIAPRILPRHLLATADAAKRAAYAREPVHAGPFSVAAWVPGYGVTLAAFRDHVGGPPALGRIEVRFFKDRTTILDALRRGDVDVAPSPVFEADIAPTLDRVADTNRLERYYTAAEALDVLRFAPRGRFADARVREAVELTIDRQAIVDDIFAGRARVPRSYLVPPLWAAAEDAPIAKPDRATARALLAQAGYTAGAFGILERPGDRLTLTLLVVAGSQARVDVARRIAGDLAAVGIAADVSARAEADVATLVAKGDFDLAVMPLTASDAMRATETWTALVDPWFDVLAAAARRADDAGEKRQLYGELQRVWRQARPALPLYQHLRVDVAARDLTGIQAPPRESALSWNVADWRFSAR